MLAPVAERIDARLPAERRFALRLWDGSELPARADDADAVTLHARSPHALAHVIHEPNQLGLGRAWVSGALDVDGSVERALALTEVFDGVHVDWRDRLAMLRAARRLGALLRRPPIPASEARLRGRRHSLRRDQAAVRHHYDVSNAFYRHVLGPSMVYSCAYFASPDETLEAAQERKLDVICRKLRLHEGERFLDVGCGWGSLVIHAASRYGARAVGATLSEPQARLARERIQAAGVADRAEIRVSDYREVADGPYDKIASVGMYEHVGASQLDDYMGTMRRLLRPGGLFLNHGIVRDRPQPRDPDTFIARYVFPDGELHAVSTAIAAMERAGLEPRDDESLREHYPLTLRRWIANLEANQDACIAEAGEERTRVWRLYMAGSARSFARGDISVHQVLAAAPGAPHGLPLARAASAGDE